MKLYDFPLSSNCRKVRAVCYELGLAPELVMVDLRRSEQRDPKFLAINPNGRVPVLVDDDTVLWESNAILGYVATKYGGGSLLPAEPRARAEVDRLLFWQVAHLAPAIGKVSVELIVKRLLGQGPPDEALVAAGKADFASASRVLEAVLREDSFAVGPLSIADFALAASYSLALDVQLDVAPFPRVAAWLNRMTARESMKRVLAEARTIA
jgi:glutathione S-transferase